MTSVKFYLSILILGLTAMLVAGCAKPLSPGQSLAVNDAAEARDAALNYAQVNLGVDAVFSDVDWEKKDLTPPGFEEVATIVYTSGEWVVTVSHLVVAPKDRVYEVVVANMRHGFKWKGAIKADGNVIDLSGYTLPAS